MLAVFEERKCFMSGVGGVPSIVGTLTSKNSTSPFGSLFHQLPSPPMRLSGIYSSSACQWCEYCVMALFDSMVFPDSGCCEACLPITLSYGTEFGLIAFALLEV